MKRDFPMMKSQGRENAQAKAIALNPNSPKKNVFYVLQSRSDQESSLDVVINMLKLFPLMYMVFLVQEIYFHL